MADTCVFVNLVTCDCYDPFSLVVAMDAQNGIGKDDGLPWHLPGDLKHFKDVTCRVKDPTKNNCLLWASRHEVDFGKFQPLPKRINCVLTRNKNFNFPEGVIKTEICRRH